MKEKAMKDKAGKDKEKAIKDNTIKDNGDTMNKAPNYTEAFEELQAIVSEIEGGEISVDELAEKVKRAALLIKICKNKLTATEGDVNKILQQLESPGETPATDDFAQG